MKTFTVNFKGRLLAVEATVEDWRVQVYSYRVVGEPTPVRGKPDGHVDLTGAMPKAEGEKATALSGWADEDRFALYDLLRAANERAQPVSDAEVGA